MSLHTPDWVVAHFAPPTEADGRFAFGGIAPASGTVGYQLEVFPPWDRPDLMRPEPLTLAVDSAGGYTVTSGVYEPVLLDGLAGLKISFAQASKTIKGYVKKDTNTPVPDAQVIAFQERGGGFAQAVTGSDGFYSLGVSGGEWMVTVQPGPGSGQVDWAYPERPQRVSFAEDTTTEVRSLDFRVISALAVVRGQVVDPHNSPVMQAHVEVRNTSGLGNGGNPNQQGYFKVNVPAGTYQVRVFLPPESTYGPPVPRTVTVARGKPWRWTRWS